MTSNRVDMDKAGLDLLTDLPLEAGWSEPASPIPPLLVEKLSPRRGRAGGTCSVTFTPAWGIVSGEF